MPRWFYSLDGKSKIGPVELDELRRLAGRGELKPGHMLLAENTGKWQPASALAELFGVTTAPRPAPPPLPPQKSSEPARRSGHDVAISCLMTPVVTCKEIGRRITLARLRRRLRRLQQEEQKLFSQVGGGLLSVGTAIPGGEAVAADFRKLQEKKVAAQQGMQKAESAQLDALSVRFGEMALHSRVSFTGRPETQSRWEQLRQDMANTQSAIAQREKTWKTSPPMVKRQVVAGLGLFIALLLLAGWIAWPSKSSDPQPQPTPNPVVAEKPLTKQPLKDLFSKLHPSVPLIRAIDVGSGSGFLVKHEDKLLVVTNRHVVENSRKGIAVDFLDKDGKTKLTIEPAQTEVIAIHRSADLAIIDVSKATAAIESNKLVPIVLAPVEYAPESGEDVFTIGHPAGGEGVLSLTTTTGIVSGVNRLHPGKERNDEARYLQITASINPGNSGGPLFDYFGRVIGVNTFIIRGNPNSGVPLEGLNFSLESRFIHELLTDSSKNLAKNEIVAIIAPAAPSGGTAGQRLERFLQGGFRPMGGSVENSVRVMRVPGGTQQYITIRCRSGQQYAALGIIKPSARVIIGVANSQRMILAKTDPSTAPDLSFQPERMGTHLIFVENPSTEPIEAHLLLLSK